MALTPHKQEGTCVTHHTSVVLEVKEDTVEPLPGLGLADDDGRVDLLPELGLALLDGSHNHIADTASRQPVQPCADTLDRDDVEVSCARVVCAVHDRTTVLQRLAFFLPRGCKVKRNRVNRGGGWRDSKQA